MTSDTTRWEIHTQNDKEKGGINEKQKDIGASELRVKSRTSVLGDLRTDHQRQSTTTYKYRAKRGKQDQMNKPTHYEHKVSSLLSLSFW